MSLSRFCKHLRLQSAIRISNRYFSETASLQARGSIVGFYSNGEELRLTPQGTIFNDDRWNGQLLSQLKSSGKPLKRGQSRVFYSESEVCALACLGEQGLDYSESEERDDAAEAVREAVGTAISQLQSLELTRIDVDPCNQIQAAAEAATLRNFSFDELKSEEKRIKRAEIVPLLYSDNQREVLEAWTRGEVPAAGQNVARRLMELPSNHLTPDTYVKEVTQLMSKLPVSMNADIDTSEMRGLLAVGKGSQYRPRFIELRYSGCDGKHLALVGKGVTFDSGGISIKPSAGMEAMRADMGGSACVVGALWAAATLELPVNLVGYLAVCENMPSSTALKPGDVITSMNGKTIQVDNTDAEGRLILADALHYACLREPAAVIDLATLTGAMDVALGSAAAGAFSTDTQLYRLMQQAGSVTGDRVVRMPLYQHYSRQVTESHLADVNNIGKHGRQAGACTAAAFLKEFVTPDMPWMHLDIAGVMENKDEYKYLGRGMSGRPTRTLVEFCERFFRRLD